MTESEEGGLWINGSFFSEDDDDIMKRIKVLNKKKLEEFTELEEEDLDYPLDE